MKFNYFKYLKTEDWKIRKKELLNEANHICSECGGKAILLHHISYDNLGYEILNLDVIALCKSCHDLMHEDKITGYEDYDLGYGEKYGEW